MEVIYKSQALLDIDYWKKSGNKIIQQRISKLIIDICEHPYVGIGKPEALKFELTGLWSRRINSEHRIIYEIVNDDVHILSLRGHYNKK